MSICLVSKDWNKTNGPGTYAKDLSSELEEKGLDFTLVCPKPKQPIRNKDDYYPKNAEIIEVSIQSHAPFLYWFFFAFNASIRIKRIQKKKKFRIIHVVDARGYIPNGDVPTIGTVHDSYIADVSLNPLRLRRFYFDWVTRYLYYNFAKIWERLILPRYTALVFNSHFTKSKICLRYNIPPAKSKVIYPSVAEPLSPSEGIENLRSKLGISDNKVILFIGMNLQRKGLEFLIRAAKEIISEIKTKFIIIGGSPIEQQKMYRLCKDLKVEPNFTFLGKIPHSEIFDFYYLSDILVVPSIVEAFGRVYLEAMSVGTPVVAGKAGGVSEFIKDRYNGILVTPSNFSEIADSIKYVLKNTKFRNELIKNGKKTSGQFSTNSMMEKTLRLYENYSKS